MVKSEPILAANRPRKSFTLELIERQAAAEALGVSARTIDRWHLLRSGPPRIKIGNKIFYRPEAIQEWLARHETVGPRDRGAR